jgi:hypothetical protein
MINNKQEQSGQTGDRLAKSIADPIIKWQRKLAAILNNRVNQYSRKRQQWLLVLYCGVSICGLLICLFVPFGKIATQRQDFQPSHIGLPSDLPAKKTLLKPTDSLTTKN